MTEAYYADDLALLANALSQAETLLRSLEKAGDIDLYVNGNKTEFLCFKQE